MKKLIILLAVLITALLHQSTAQAQDYVIIPSTCTHVYMTYTKDRFGRTIQRPVCLTYSQPQTIVFPKRRSYNPTGDILNATVAGVATYYILDRSNKHHRYHSRYRYSHRDFRRCVHQHRPYPC